MPRTASFAPGADCMLPLLWNWGIVSLKTSTPSCLSNLEPLFFSAWYMLLSFHWENAKAWQYCHSLSHGKDAVKPPTAHTMPLTPKANQEWFHPNIHTKRLSLQYFRQTLWPACSFLIIWGLSHVTSHCSLSKGAISLGKQNIGDQGARMLLGYPS